MFTIHKHVHVVSCVTAYTYLKLRLTDSMYRSHRLLYALLAIQFCIPIDLSKGQILKWSDCVSTCCILVSSSQAPSSHCQPSYLGLHHECMLRHYRRGDTRVRYLCILPFPITHYTHMYRAVTFTVPSLMKSNVLSPSKLIFTFVCSSAPIISYVDY